MPAPGRELAHKTSLPSRHLSASGTVMSPVAAAAVARPAAAAGERAAIEPPACRVSTMAGRRPTTAAGAAAMAPA